MPEQAVSSKNNSSAAKAVKLSDTKLWKHPSGPVRLALACFLLCWSLSSFFVAFTAEAPFFSSSPSCVLCSQLAWRACLWLKSAEGWQRVGEAGLGVPVASRSLVIRPPADFARGDCVSPCAALLFVTLSAPQGLPPGFSAQEIN